MKDFITETLEEFDRVANSENFKAAILNSYTANYKLNTYISYSSYECIIRYKFSSNLSLSKKDLISN